MESAQAAQCMPSNTTLDSQQLGCCGSGRLKADHSSGSSSSESGTVSAASEAAARSGKPGAGKGRGEGDRLTVGILIKLSDFVAGCPDLNKFTNSRQAPRVERA
jgi:hypothetical protein